MTKIHLLQATNPFTHNLIVATEPYPQKVTASIIDSSLHPQILDEGSVLIQGKYDLLIEYSTPNKDKQVIRKVQSITEKVPIEVIPDLPHLMGKLNPGERWNLTAAITNPNIVLEPICPKGAIITDEGIRSLCLIPQAISLEITGEITIDGWLEKQAALPTVEHAGRTAQETDKADNLLSARANYDLEEPKAGQQKLQQTTASKSQYYWGHSLYPASKISICTRRKQNLVRDLEQYKKRKTKIKPTVPR
ncbi:MAG: hypothetical protein ACOX3A_02205 [bacterium]|jgi:hypothetical protein